MKNATIGLLALIAIIFVGVAFAGPALAHDETPTGPTTNETVPVNQTAWVSWMADHMTEEEFEWMIENHERFHAGPYGYMFGQPAEPGYQNGQYSNGQYPSQPMGPGSQWGGQYPRGGMGGSYGHC